jgi:hypothetical protein
VVYGGGDSFILAARIPFDLLVNSLEREESRSKAIAA